MLKRGVKVIDIQMTKDAQKLMAASYKLYLERRSNGVDKIRAKVMSPKDLKPQNFSDFSVADYRETVSEMCRALKCTQYRNGGFVLSDGAIIYMENRFKNGLKDVVDFLSSLSSLTNLFH